MNLLTKMRRHAMVGAESNSRKKPLCSIIIYKPLSDPDQTTSEQYRPVFMSSAKLLPYVSPDKAFPRFNPGISICRPTEISFDLWTTYPPRWSVSCIQTKKTINWLEVSIFMYPNYMLNPNRPECDHSSSNTICKIPLTPQCFHV